MEDPDVDVTQEYGWYLRGCRAFERSPIGETEFRTQYARYRRCKRVLDAYYLQIDRFKSDNNVAEMIREIRQVRDLLAHLDLIVSVGCREDGMGGSDGIGNSANLGPVRPVLTGAAAKLLPPFDPEPQWRDP